MHHFIMLATKKETTDHFSTNAKIVCVFAKKKKHSFLHSRHPCQPIKTLHYFHNAVIAKQAPPRVKWFNLQGITNLINVSKQLIVAKHKP